MGTLLVSVLLFGLVHPASKLILETGLPLSSFCFLYVGIRFLVQIPIHIFGPSKNTTNNKFLLVFLLVLLGFLGAGLQFFEFKGIDDGLDPGLVTFIIFSYPVWLAIFSLFTGQHDDKSIVILKIATGMCGLFLVCSSHIKSFESVDILSLTFPWLASLFIAGWIGLSNILRKKHMPSRNLSFYYDLFSLVTLLFFLFPSLQNELNLTIHWLGQPMNLLSMVSYSLLIGLLPNYLFYEGSHKVSALTAGMLMSIEPVFSTIYSNFLWGGDLSLIFYIGATLIICANIPNKLFVIFFKKRVKNERATAVSSFEKI